jgi:hypothetical protein
VSQIFIIEGFTGIYEDRLHWIVDAWSSEESARARIRELTVLVAPLNRLQAQRDWAQLENAKLAMKKHDSQFSIDTSGTHYRFITCELKS